MNCKFLLLVILIVRTSCVFALSLETSNHSDSVMLIKELERQVQYKSYTIRFAAYHLETDMFVYLNGDEYFPMASLSKFLMALTYLDLVDQHVIDATKRIDISHAQLRPYSVFSKLFINPDVSITLNQALEAMMIYSDNTATDIIFREIGGAKAINNFMKNHDINHINVSRSILEMLAANEGVALTDEFFISLSDYYEKSRGVGRVEEERYRKKFFSDKKDSATAKAFLIALKKFYYGELLSKDSTDYLMTIMNKNAHGTKRLKAFLPSGKFAHKTGSLSMLTNDAGIYVMPDDKGHLIFVGSVMEQFPERLPDSRDYINQRETLLALLAKTVYDFVIFK